MANRVASRFGGREESTTIGFGQRLPAPLAGWVNGIVGHGPDYDDVHGVAAVHPSCVGIPASLAIGEARNATGELSLLSFVLGAETGLRILTGAPPEQFHYRGIHGTGVAGPFIAAAIGCKILGLDVGQTANALGMAGSQSSGLLQTLVDGSWQKRLHPGWAVQSGLTCALLASEGFTGVTEVIEGKFGLFHALLFGDEALFDFNHITADLGTRWMLPETTYKPWPNGMWNHASMDATASIVLRENLSDQDIVRIDCFVPPICVDLVAEPRAEKLNPSTPYHLKFSLPLSVAMLVVLRHMAADDFNEVTMHDPRIRALAERVFCHADDSMPPQHYPARVHITTSQGREFVEEVRAARGGIENPMSKADHKGKFWRNAAPTLGSAKTDALLSALESAWDASNIAHLVRLSVAAAT
jgi:2-methylcitrate dehydratase PrpD